MSLLIAVIVLAILGALIWNHFHWKAEAWPVGALTLPRYQNHRGFWQESLPENSLAAFRESLRRGYAMIELDVRLSRDGVAVVYHDPDLQRMHQDLNLVAHLDFARLKEKFNIDSLGEVLDELSSKILVNIEIKSEKWFDNSLEAAVVKEIFQHRAEGRVMISSFNPLTLHRLRKLAPQIPRALLATGELNPRNKIYLRQMWLAPYVRPHILHLDHRFVNQEQLSRYQKRGIPVALWTVNDPEAVSDYFAVGVKSLISDSLPAIEDSSPGKKEADKGPSTP